jgi:hypothetical protein
MHTSTLVYRGTEWNDDTATLRVKHIADHDFRFQAIESPSVLISIDHSSKFSALETTIGVDRKCQLKTFHLNGKPSSLWLVNGEMMRLLKVFECLCDLFE